jgi:hypothetical protein
MKCCKHVKDNPASQCARCSASHLENPRGNSRHSLSDYLLMEIREVVERPTLTELRERLHGRQPVSVDLDTARPVQEERDTR